LHLKLRSGVKWHDGKPFTARDVQCTWDKLLGKHPDHLRKSPRRVWWRNLKEVTVEGDLEATFVLEAPQASFPVLIASNMTPVYPCHVPAKDMRSKPVGTGPFKFVAFDSNRTIKLARNADYWKPGLPYLDGVEMSIISSRSTRILAFTANEFDLTAVSDVTAPIMVDVKARVPKAVCRYVPIGASTNLLVNRNKPPFDNALLRRAMSLALDRQAMIDTLSAGKASLAGAMLPLPQGRWGMPKEVLETLPGYGGDMTSRRAEARKIMEGLGYGPGKRLKVKVTTRDWAVWKDPAVMLVDQLNQIHFDAELEVVESSIWFVRASKHDYAVALNLTGSAVDDPDVNLVENYACKSERNYTGYCNARVDALLAKQSQEADLEKRKRIVWEIERTLAEDTARPIIFHGHEATCWHPHVKGLLKHENTTYNNWRFESVWLDK
jgi:peptide/nickel transport system substrate-binding protein